MLIKTTIPIENIGKIEIKEKIEIGEKASHFKKTEIFNGQCSKNNVIQIRGGSRFSVLCMASPELRGERAWPSW